MIIVLFGPAFKVFMKAGLLKRLSFLTLSLTNADSSGIFIVTIKGYIYIIIVFKGGER